MLVSLERVELLLFFQLSKLTEFARCKAQVGLQL